MPRDGSQIYHRPPGTDGIPDTTIESTKYNINVADVEQDLNLPRPIIAGGTGANNARDAMINLSGEIAKQTVNNYDEFPFVSGSFYSPPRATAAPTADVDYAGICYAIDDTTLTLEARAVSNPALKYVRQKYAGSWGSWIKQTGSTAELDATYVNVAGDTMTGTLNIQNASPQLVLNGTTTGGSILGLKNSSIRWVITPGNNTPEGAGNTGCDFDINSFDNAGSILGTPFRINRGTNLMETGSHNCNGNLAVAGGSTLNGILTVNALTNLNGGLAVAGGATINGAALTVNAGINANGDLHTNGVVLTGVGGATATQFGGGAGVGFYNDGTNIAIRASTSGVIIFQTANGGATLGSISPTTLNLPNNINISGTGSIAGAFTAGGVLTGNGGIHAFSGGSYNYRVIDQSVRTWGWWVNSANGNLSLDDITGARQALQVVAFGAYSSIYLPGIPISGAPAGPVVLESSTLMYQSSSRRYKTDIKPLTKPTADKLLQLEPITYRSTCEVDDKNKTYIGFVAEDVAKVDPTFAVWDYLREDWIEEQPDKDKPVERRLREGAIKVPNAIDYARFSVLAVYKIQEQEDRINKLLERIEALEGAAQPARR